MSQGAGTSSKGTIVFPIDVVPLTEAKKSDRIAGAIKRWIVDQDLKTGDRLPPAQDLAPLFGCGKGTMREALKSLEVQGLIVMRTGPRGGPILKTPGYARTAEQLRTYLNFKQLDVNHIYNLRLIIEPEMAVNTMDVITDEILDALRANVAACRDIAIAGGRSVRDRELDFHVILAEACPDPLLSFQSLFITDLLRGFIVFENAEEAEFGQFTNHNCDYHDDLIEALAEKDRERVYRVFREYMQASRKRSLELCGKVVSNLLLQPAVFGVNGR